MCVIIYIPKKEKITKSELETAWQYNSDGGGIAWAQNGKTFYQKGFMDFKTFYNKMKKIIDNTEIERIIHFRITSVGTTNKKQTHPFIFKNGIQNKGLLRYKGRKPLCFMNGTIANQKIVKNLNDTASFICENSNNINNFKEKARKSGQKWAIITPHSGVDLIGKFEKKDGIYYSNLNHEYYDNLFYYQYNKKNKNNITKKELSEIFQTLGYENYFKFNYMYTYTLYESVLYTIQDIIEKGD